MSIHSTIFFVAYFCVSCFGKGLPGQTQHTVKPGYVHYPKINGYLKLHTEPADWTTATKNCHNEDANLDSPWTNDFTSAVHELLSNAEHSIEDESNEEQWLPLVFSGTLEKFPVLESLPGVMTDSERCGVFYANGTTGHVSCKLSLPFVCYAVVTALQPTSTSGYTTLEYTTPEYTTPEYTTSEYTTQKSTLAPVPSCIGFGYELAKQTMSCYKFNVNGQTWTNAKATCISEGASLAIINSGEEAGVLARLFYKYPTTSIKNVFHANDLNNAHVGMFFESGVWKSVNYQTLEQAGYAQWYDASFPHQYQNSYPYGAMNRNGKYMTARNGNLAFICEKAPVYNS